MGNIGVPEMIFIFILALLVFGPRKLPELGRTLGKALAEFRKHSSEVRMAFEEEMRELERHAQEVESKSREALEPAAAALAPPEGAVGAGPIDPQQGASAAAAPPPLETEARPPEKPADGEPKPA